MPVRIEHIDAIARQKQRDVLYVVFHPPASGTPDDEEILGSDDQPFNWNPANGRTWSMAEIGLGEIGVTLPTVGL